MNRQRRTGFTLIEILLVVAIMAIASAVAVPMFARSFRGAKLRNSLRTVTMMHRNAQSKAVLGQRYMALLYDEVKGTVELVDQGQPGQKKDAFFGDVGSSSGMGDVAGGGDGLSEETEASGATSDFIRKLEDGVEILDFDGGKEFDGIFYVSYFPNGMCDAYTIKIGDDENRTGEVDIDPVTGKARVSRE
jgi:prepilin-type N-terminal cleavage/methylation domain-containing protein